MIKAYCVGKQEDVAAAVSRLLWGNDNNRAAVLDFMRAQRYYRKAKGRSRVLSWRGIGIDVTPRACACWIESAERLDQWRKACAESVAR